MRPLTHSSTQLRTRLVHAVIHWELELWELELWELELWEPELWKLELWELELWELELWELELWELELWELQLQLHIQLGSTATATALGSGALGATATALGAGALGATATATATHTATATATALGAGALGAVPWPPLRRLPSHPPILLILLSWKWLISCCFVFSPCNEASVTPKL